MLDQGRVAAQPDERRERLFTERYEGLLSWAMRLTSQQREAAEDLVQDAFVQFMLGRTRLEEIENIDGYLRRMLRYMHLSRISRSAQHLRETELSVADYDSVRLSWTATEPSRRMQSSEELYQICAYACSRKESSRAGSVLILRFFHEYLPTEIAGVIHSSRHCVDQWQRLARGEAKLFMNEPERLRFVNARNQSRRQRPRYLRSDCDLMVDLRRVIFNSCRGGCLSREELEEIYARSNADALTTAKLAHIVSCYACLDFVNTLLGLPLLAERHEFKPSEPQDPPQGPDGGGASGGGSTDLPKKFARQLRETREHKPQELRIAVNGFLVSSLKVSAELSELNLNLTGEDPIEFVEVSSEQSVQLLFFSVDPKASDRPQWAWIELSEGRSLEAYFRNDNGPALHVIYQESAPEEAFIAGETPANTLSSPLFVVSDGEPVSKIEKETSSLLTKLKARLGSRIVAREDANRSANDTIIHSLDKATSKALETPLSGLLGSGSLPAQSHYWRRVGFLMALISAALVAGFVLLKTKTSPPLNAAALLEEASVAERRSDRVPDRVRHRLINLEERRSPEGAVVAQQKIELWENTSTGQRSQRLYDGSNRLIGGASQRTDGSRTVYHHGAKPRSLPALAAPENLLLNPEDIWQLELCAQVFSAIVGEATLVHVDERATTYLLRYEGERRVGASRLLKATLTLSKSDLHAVEQTLLVQRGGELRDYRFVEASIEFLTAKDVAPAAFELEPELTGGAGNLGRPGDWALRDLTSSRVPPSPSTSAPPSASAELEVDVAYLLNQAKADRNEQVALTRSVGGSLRVEGIVDSQQRKDEFLRALAPVSNNPAVKIEIRTIDEAFRPTTTVSSVSIEVTEETANTLAVDKELRAYFRSKAPDGPTDEMIRAYSSRVVNVSYKSLFHAIELKRLVNRFSGVDMRTVAPDARAKWLAMLREHATAFARDTATLRREIEPIFFPGVAQNVLEEISIQSDADLARAVERLHRLALSNNDAIRSAITTSAKSSASALKSIQFKRSLVLAEELAERIRRYED
jgi:RNA polymerase sigma factor (sigma-70 family)